VHLERLPPDDCAGACGEGASAGTLDVLGLRRISARARPTTAYLMVGESCVFDCAFCAQARSSAARSDALSRVTWPRVSLADVVERVRKAHRAGAVQRACVQVVSSDGAMERARRVVEMLSVPPGVPTSVSARLAGSAAARRVIDWGAERVAMPLDCASPSAFGLAKGRDSDGDALGGWKKAVAAVEEAARALAGRVSAHLIVGLGETEEEAVTLVQRLHDLGVTVGLFAFTPVRGTRLQGRRPPDLSSYRRVQAAAYMISIGASRAERMTFRGGRLAGFGVSTRSALEILRRGEAFRTSGCPGCNRPFYNERPGDVPYNYPRDLNPDEVRAAASLALGLEDRGFTA